MIEKLQNILDKTVDNKHIFGAVLSVASPSLSWTGSSGNIENDSFIFIASTTKLYTTTLIYQLLFEKKIDLDDKISNYLDDSILEGLHLFKGKDYADAITIRHLISQTSGLPDYFEQKNTKGIILLDEITSGRDRSWSFDDVITLSKKMKPKFAPGAKGKAFYSDTNFQLLGKIIEVVTGKSFDANLEERIVKRLNLVHTYMYRDPTDKRPKPLYFKKNLLDVPKAMSSFGPDGGIVSTAQEVMTFLKAFFDGKLFPKDYIKEAKTWNPMFFPLEYGVGLMRFKLPRIFSPFKPLPELIGHSGLSGAFAFYVPEKEIFLTGTVNQIHNPGRSFKLMLKVIHTINS